MISASDRYKWGICVGERVCCSEMKSNGWMHNTVTFDDFENQEIRCAFGFGAIDGDSHMKMLQEIVMLLQDHEFIELITNNGSKAAIMKKIDQY